MYTEESKNRAYRAVELPADEAKLPEVLSFIEECMEVLDASAKTSMQILVAAEEVFVNIAHYAYEGEEGTVGLRVETETSPPAVKITFSDHGIPYNPLDREDPDITLPLEERTFGGLGIFMARKMMDDIRYEFADGQNVLMMTKRIN